MWKSFQKFWSFWGQRKTYKYYWKYSGIAHTYGTAGILAFWVSVWTFLIFLLQTAWLPLSECISGIWCPLSVSLSFSFLGDLALHNAKHILLIKFPASFSLNSKALLKVLSAPSVLHTQSQKHCEWPPRPHKNMAILFDSLPNASVISQHLISLIDTPHESIIIFKKWWTRHIPSSPSLSCSSMLHYSNLSTSIKREFSILVLWIILNPHFDAKPYRLIGNKLCEG